MRHALTGTADFVPWQVQLYLLAAVAIFGPAIAIIKRINRSIEGPIYLLYFLVIGPVIVIGEILAVMNKYWVRLSALDMMICYIALCTVLNLQRREDARLRKLLRLKPLIGEERARSQELRAKLMKMKEAQKRPAITPEEQPPR